MIVLITVAIIIVQFLLLQSAIFALWKKKSYRAVVDQTTNPRCTIILPCKGTPTNFKENITSFFKLDYANYEVLLAVESENDSAVPIIKEVIRSDKRGKLIVAGLTHSCGQKNHNLIEAVKQANNPNILLFADSDIKLFPHWIETMITPLEKEDITAVTGFRWLYSSNRDIGAHAHSYQNYLLFSLFSVSSATMNTGLWGGSMAIAKKDFEALNIAEVWGKTSVDDMSLSALLKKERVKTHFSYDCITPTDDTINSFPNTIRWFTRQVMYLKAHQKVEWGITMIICLILSIAYLLVPYSLIQMGLGNSFWHNGGFASLFLFGSTIFNSLLFSFMGRAKHPLLFSLFSPLSLISVLWGVWGTLFTNTIIWSGVKYNIRFRDGSVTKVERI